MQCAIFFQNSFIRKAWPLLGIMITIILGIKIIIILWYDVGPKRKSPY